jgi:hypothetical protein
LWYNCLLYCSRVSSRHGVFAFQLARFTRRDFRSLNYNRLLTSAPFSLWPHTVEWSGNLHTFLKNIFSLYSCTLMESMHSSKPFVNFYWTTRRQYPGIWQNSQSLQWQFQTPSDLNLHSETYALALTSSTYSIMFQSFPPGILAIRLHYPILGFDKTAD